MSIRRYSKSTGWFGRLPRGACSPHCTWPYPYGEQRPRTRTDRCWSIPSSPCASHSHPRLPRARPRSIATYKGRKVFLTKKDALGFCARERRRLFLTSRVRKEQATNRRKCADGRGRSSRRCSDSMPQHAQDNMGRWRSRSTPPFATLSSAAGRSARRQGVRSLACSVYVINYEQ